MRPLWLSSLATLLEADQIETTPALLQAHAVDRCVPSAIVFPETVEQTAAVLRWAQSEHFAVLPRGAGTLMSLGGIPQRADVVLSTSRLQRVSDYDAANFTLTAEAGMSVAAVARLIAANQQMLPLHYPFSPATLGGLLATNADAPKRLLYGGIRDLLLGLRVAFPSGEIAHFGAKVVKNVAGYDLPKLFLGSLGTLGVIVEATFKLYPLPERDETVCAVFPTGPHAAAAAEQLLGAPLLPSQVLVLNPWAAVEVVPPGLSAVADGRVAMLVNVEGMHEAVERQLREIAEICRQHEMLTVDVVAGELQVQLRQRLAAMVQTSTALLSPLPRDGDSPHAGVIIIRVGTLPSRVPLVMDAIAQALQPSLPPALMVGDCGVGQVRVTLRGAGHTSEAGRESLVQALRGLPRLVAADGGHVVIEAAPTAVKERLDVWGPPPSAFSLLKALKAKFDPGSTLNPGRLIGGL
jgi:glycolate oxidase FAD binding subunit